MDAVAAYDELLEDDAVASESCGRLRDGQRERSLVFGEHPLSVALRPRLVDRGRYEAAVAASQTLYQALQKLEGALLRDAGLRSELDLDPEEERLALADPGIRASAPSARLDGFYSDRLRYVEYNSETPAGIAYSDHLAEVFETLPAMRAFRKRYRVRALKVRQRLLQTLLRVFREWGKAEEPVIAIVDWTEMPTVSEFEMFRDYFDGHGVKTVICDPRDLEYRGGRLYASGVHVNLVYKRVLVSELLARPDESRALRDAYCAGAACVVNTFRGKLLTRKICLALLSDERYGHLYTGEEREVIARHVPWTRKLREGPATRNGREIADLAEYVAGHREELVLKPNDEFGGRGVVLGWTVEQDEWEQDLMVALTQSYVVQEAVEIPKERYPVALDGVKFLDFSVDLDPYLFHGRVTGALTRISSSALLNVTAGAGSVVPTYLVEGAR